MSLAEREEISRGLCIKQSLRSIARSLGRAVSTISREVKRNGGSAAYRAASSEKAAWQRALRPKTCKLKTKWLATIKDAISISERPASVEDRAVPGHWEGDLIAGSKNSYIATLVEQQTRYVMLAKVANKDTNSVVTALIKQAHKLPSELYKSLIWDRGRELSSHKRFTLETDINVYFCDPQSPLSAALCLPVGQCMAKGLKRKYKSPAKTIFAEGD